MNFLLMKALGWLPALKRLSMNPTLVLSSLCKILPPWLAVDVLVVLPPLRWYLVDTGVMVS